MRANRTAPDTRHSELPALDLLWGQACLSCLLDQPARAPRPHSPSPRLTASSSFPGSRPLCEPHRVRLLTPTVFPFPGASSPSLCLCLFHIHTNTRPSSLIQLPPQSLFPWACPVPSGPWVFLPSQWALSLPLSNREPSRWTQVLPWWPDTSTSMEARFGVGSRTQHHSESRWASERSFMVPSIPLG